MSRPYAEVIGDPIAHSKSPLIHNFWIGKVGIDADYGATHVRGTDLGSFLRSRRADERWRGCNVTLPHKRDIVRHLDRLDESAAAVGAVNTVVRREGLLLGYNTDGRGFLEPILPLLAAGPTGRSAALIGAGGAALAVAGALHSAGFDLTLYNRDPESAWHRLGPLCSDPRRNRPLTELASGLLTDRDRLDLIVNATSLGMEGQPDLAIDLRGVTRTTIVYDLVYAPLETALLRRARAAGLPTIDGLQMLVGQAALAFELFFGQLAPRAHDAELRELLAR